MENQFSQEKLDALIERHLNTKGNKISKLFTEGKKTAKYTELNSRFNDIELPEKVIFKRSYLTRIVNTVIGIGIILGAPMFVFIMGLFVGMALIMKSWFLGEENSLEINHIGIVYNDTMYKWGIIEKTLILTETRGKNESDEVHLVLALTSGKNKILETTDLEFRRNGMMNIKDVLVSRTQLMSHFVELYKNPHA